MKTSNKPYGTPPMLGPFAFHLGSLTRCGCIEFEASTYRFMDKDYVNINKLEIAKFWGISYNRKWLIGFFTFSRAEEINREK